MVRVYVVVVSNKKWEVVLESNFRLSCVIMITLLNTKYYIISILVCFLNGAPFACNETRKKLNICTLSSFSCVCSRFLFLLKNWFWLLAVFISYFCAQLKLLCIFTLLVKKFIERVPLENLESRVKWRWEEKDIMTRLKTHSHVDQRKKQLDSHTAETN